MEGCDQSLGNGGSRWNPTKEQINMLEGLYRQGLRTPTAEQIQQITARLRDYGHIEGKNVFYWFQNHKARQRQKQKQQSFALYSRFLHAPVFPPPYHHNVICSPCYIPPPQNDAIFYKQNPKVQLPTTSGGLKRSRAIPQQTIESSHHSTLTQRYTTKSAEQHPSHDQETLDLFPIHPTGILQSRSNDSSHEIKNPFSAHHSSMLATSTDDQPFFDFFCGN